MPDWKTLCTRLNHAVVELEAATNAQERIAWAAEVQALVALKESYRSSVGGERWGW